MEDRTLYGYTLAEHEYQVDVPKMYVDAVDEPVITVAISAHGGGTVGTSYFGTGWDYAVYADGREVISGQDLRSGGAGGTHEGMARTLCAFLANDAETITTRHASQPEDAERLGVYDDEATAFLESEGERLSLYSL